MTMTRKGNPPRGTTVGYSWLILLLMFSISHNQQVALGQPVRIGVLSMAPDQGGQWEQIVHCGNVTGSALDLAVLHAQLSAHNLTHMTNTLVSMYQLSLDFLLIVTAHTTVLHPFLIKSLLLHPPPANLTIIPTKELPRRDYQWCCAIEDRDPCCHGNNVSRGNVSMKITLSNDVMKVDFLREILKKLEWKTTFVILDEQHEELIRTLSRRSTGPEPDTLYTLVSLSQSSNWNTVKAAISDSLMSTDTLNAVLTCSLPCIKRVLQMTLSLESEFKRRVSVIQSTKWVLVPSGIDRSSRAILNDIFALGFDNIAVVIDPAFLDEPNAMADQYLCSVLTVSTLLWKEGSRRQLSPVGRYCSTNGANINADIFPNTKFVFNGRHFIVSTMLWDPYIMKKEENGTAVFYGLCADLLRELARTLNFTYTWTEPKDMMWGHNNSGNWSGLVGQLNRQEVDLVMAPLAMSKEREGAMDFTFPFYHDFSGVLLKRPDPNATKWRTYIDIFRWQVLMCLALALVGGSIVCISIEAGEGIIFGGPTLWESLDRFWLVLGALLSQGCRKLPERGSGRVFLASWWVFSIMLAATYSGNLIAFLTVTKDKAPFDTLQEMVRQDDYRYGTIDQSMWTMLFEFSNSPTYQAIHRNMRRFAKDDPRVLNSDPYVHLEMVREGHYAYIADTGLFDSWLATNCDLMLIKEKFYPSKYAAGLPNDSAYTQLFSDQIMKIYESGLLQVWVKRWWPKRNFCAGALTTEARVLTLLDLQSVFYVAGVGMVLSVAVLFGELFINSACGCTKKNRRRNSGYSADTETRQERDEASQCVS